MARKLTHRQQAWLDASDQAEREGNMAAGLFALLAMPNEQERQRHDCAEHAVGFRRDNRRGFKCGICSDVLVWLDPEEG
jgi:hypothetical protein